MSDDLGFNSFFGREPRFGRGDRVTKRSGSSWTGVVVGFYSTNLTPIGYAVESENEPGSVQIYPESALDFATQSTQEAVEANARLIAAAPDMLEALEQFVEEYVEMVHSGDCGFWDPEKEDKVIKARAAISKALTP